ncbi:hypothetical protein IW16_06155 [Chryseobacterium vrystaatense]|uniref:Uncharacterized protein n=2 Tax=Chryseobacterium vrystaatense TaxID=307480 RepID=A0ABR4UPD3_9FLAO|nr:hypothetical protein IW16_06155 [Chryseobacterium vrystaatense]
MNNILSLRYDLEGTAYAGFPNMNVAVFQYSLLVVPFTLIPAVYLRAYWVSYIVPIFVYINIIGLYVAFHYGVLKNPDWIFYISVTGISLIILIFYGFVREYYFNLIEEENGKNEIIELYEKEFIDHGSK